MPSAFRRFALTAAMALTIPIVAVQAQPRPASDDDAIVVEGIKERRQQIRRFVGTLTDTHFRGQIARFDWDVCPIALGMPGDQNRDVTERMRRIAAAAGMPMGEPGCDANAILIVTPDKPATMRMLRREYPDLFFTQTGERMRLDRAAPISAWQVEGRLTSDGLEVGTGGSNGSTYYVSEVTGVSSRIRPATRPHFKASIMVVQLDALRGLTTTQLADYAAMRIYARTDPADLDASTVPTILTLMEAPMGAEVPVTLTQWDLSFLRALYGSTENRYAEQQRHEMRRLFERDLERSRNAPAD